MVISDFHLWKSENELVSEQLVEMTILLFYGFRNRLTRIQPVMEATARESIFALTLSKSNHVLITLAFQSNFWFEKLGWLEHDYEVRKQTWSFQLLLKHSNSFLFKC